MKRIDNKGMSLLETIIAIAIFGIFMVAFLNFFSFGLDFVAKSGHRNNAVFMAQNSIEKAYTGTITTETGITRTVTSTSIEINLPSLSGITIISEGELVSTKAELNNEEAVIDAFIP